MWGNGSLWFWFPVSWLCWTPFHIPVVLACLLCRLLLISLTHFLIKFLFFNWIVGLSCLYIVDINPSSIMFTIFSSLPIRGKLPLILLIRVVYCSKAFLVLCGYNCLFLLLLPMILVSYQEITKTNAKKLFPYFYFRSFTVSGVMFESSVHRVQFHCFIWIPSFPKPFVEKLPFPLCILGSLSCYYYHWCIVDLQCC